MRQALVAWPEELPEQDGTGPLLVRARLTLGAGVHHALGALPRELGRALVPVARVHLAAGGDLAAALGRITAKTFVMPIDEDMFFPVRDCAAEQKLVPNSELRVIESVAGHLGLFGLEPGYMQQIDQHLGELLEEAA